MPNWKKSRDHQLILKKISEICEFKNGSIHFRGFEFITYRQFLTSLIDFEADFTSEDNDQLVKIALRRTAEDQNWDSKNFMRHLQKESNKRAASPATEFHLVSGINIDLNGRKIRYRDDDLEVAFQKNLPSKYREVREHFLKIAGQMDIVDTEHQPSFLIAKTQQKSFQSAASALLDYVDYIRASWNLYSNHSMRFFSGGKKKAVNRIMLGGVQTLHLANGEKAADMFWHEPNFKKGLPDFDLSTNSFGTLTYGKSVRSRLRTHPYREELKPCFVRYARALDSTDHHLSFLKLWSLLETLTATSNSGYDKTIGRSAFLFKERDFHIEILRTLREHRNRHVHADSTTPDIEQYVFSLKRYVDTLLHFHLKNRFKFDRLENACKFMDLPHLRKELAREISLRESAIEFLF